MIWLAVICIALVSGLALVSALPASDKRVKLALMVSIVIAVTAIYAVIGTPNFLL